MSLEEGTSFWSVMLMWRIFFCAIFACFSFTSVVNVIYGYSGELFIDKIIHEIMRNTFMLF